MNKGFKEECVERVVSENSALVPFCGNGDVNKCGAIEYARRE
jgi:hypothetical protein